MCVYSIKLYLNRKQINDLNQLLIDCIIPEGHLRKHGKKWNKRYDYDNIGQFPPIPTKISINRLGNISVVSVNT